MTMAPDDQRPAEDSPNGSTPSVSDAPPSHPVQLREFFLRIKVGPFTVLTWVVIACWLGLLVRLPVVRDYSLFIDDGATLYTTVLPTEKLIENRFRKGHIPVFFIIFKGWTEVVGDSLVGLRIPSLVFSMLAIPVAALLCQKLRDPRAAVLAAFITALHGSVVRHSAELRMYSWMMVIGPAIVYLLILFIEKPRLWKIAAAGVLHFFYLTLHVSSLFFTIPAFLAVALLGRGARLSKPWRGAFATAFALPIAILVPVMVYLKSHVDMKEYEKFESMDPVRQLLSSFYELMIGIGVGGDLPVIIMIGIVFPLSGFALFMIRERELQPLPSPAIPRRELMAMFLSTAFAAPILAFAITALGMKAIGYARYYITGTLPLIVFMSASITSVRWRRTLLHSMLLITFLVSGFMTFERAYYRLRKLIDTHPTGLRYLVDRFHADEKKGARILISDQGATRRIVEVYLGKSTGKHEFLEIAGGWRTDKIRRELRRQANTEAPLHLFFYRDIDDRLISLVGEFYGGHMDRKEWHKNESTYIRLRPARGAGPESADAPDE